MRPHPPPRRRAALLSRLLATALLVGTLTGLGGCKPKDAAGEGGPADSTETNAATSGRSLSLPVVGQPVRRGDLVLSVITTGRVRSEAVTTLKAEAAGTIERVRVTPGARVRKGDVLIQLDSVPFVLALQEAEAAVDQAYLKYQDLIIPDSIVTGQAPDAAKRRNAEARSGLATARVQLERAKLERARASIVAPFDGVIDRLEVSTGERVGAGEDLLTVVDVDNLWIEASVLEHDLPLIKRGGEAVVTTAAMPDKPATGTIASVLPLVDSVTRSGRALVKIRGNGALRPGMYADVQLEATRLPGRVLVPSRAVIERDGRPLVFVVKESRAQWVYINPGRSNGVDTEVLPDSTTKEIPVAVGDTVLVSGHLTLTHDAPVRLVAVSESEE